MQLSSYSESLYLSPLPGLLAKASAPGVISFAIGMPATDLFPHDAISRTGEQLLAGGGGALQYGLPSSSLKAHLVEIMARRGVSCRPEQIFLTTGAQQALRLMSRLLLDPGGSVLLEEAVYDGIQCAFSDLRPEILRVPTSSAAGLDVEAAEAHLRAGARPAFLYVIPEGHNPLGCSLSLEKRYRLLELAREYDLTLVEDDACGLLHYGVGQVDGSDPVPTLRALNDQRVIYVGSFSKILSPGLRVGWLVVPESLIPKLSALKHGDDFDTCTYSQHLIAEFLSQGHLDSHLQSIRREYRQRRDAVLEALEEHLSGIATWSCPQAGLYIWVELPASVDTAELLEVAIERGQVAFSPGQVYAPGDASHISHALRLSFAKDSPEVLREGIARLSRVVHEELIQDES